MIEINGEVVTGDSLISSKDIPTIKKPKRTITYKLLDDYRSKKTLVVKNRTRVAVGHFGRRSIPAEYNIYNPKTGMDMHVRFYTNKINKTHKGGAVTIECTPVQITFVDGKIDVPPGDTSLHWFLQNHRQFLNNPVWDDGELARNRPPALFEIEDIAKGALDIVQLEKLKAKAKNYLLSPNIKERLSRNQILMMYQSFGGPKGEELHETKEGRAQTIKFLLGKIERDPEEFIDMVNSVKLELLFKIEEGKTHDLIVWKPNQKMWAWGEAIPGTKKNKKICSVAAGLDPENALVNHLRENDIAALDLFILEHDKAMNPDKYEGEEETVNPALVSED